MRCLSSLLLILCLGFAPAHATTRGHKTCQHATTIAEMARQILNDRAGLNRIQKRRTGDIATHMLIAYGGLGQDEARRLLADLQENPPGRLTELMATWAYDAGSDQDRAGVDLSNALDLSSYSALRAMLDFDQGRTLLNALTALRGSKSGAMIWTQLATLAGHITAGWDAARRANLVSNAIAMGHPGFAAAVLAAGPDRATYLAFIEANADRPEIKAHQPRFMFDALMTVPNNTGPFKLEPTRFERDTRTYRMLQYAYTHAEMDYLLIFYNQTGEEDAVYRTADFLMTEVEQGRLDPATDFETARAMTYFQLVRHLGQQAVDQTLETFDMRGPMRFDSRARDHVDWAIAVMATRKLTQEDTPANRQRPEGLTADFDWDLWMQVYDSIQTGGLSISTLTDGGALVAIEVFYAANRIKDVFNVIAGSALKPRNRIRIYQEILLRLDRSCEGYSMAAGQGIILGGQPVFRFKD